MDGTVSDLEDFFEHGDVPLHIVSADGIILRANKAELTLLGYEREEYVGQPIAKFHADPHVIEDLLARLGRGERVKRCPARLRAKDGTLRHVVITSSGRFQSGKLVSTRCFTMDVTALKQAEEARQQVEDYYRGVLDSLSAAVYTTDAEGRITYFNEAAVTMSGRRPQLGQDRWCVTWRLFNLDGTPMAHEECPLALTLKEGRPVRGVEAIAERPDGTRVRFAPYPAPLADASGKLIGAVNLLVDVTELRKAEADAAYLAAIVASSDDAIISKTLDGRVTSWNNGAARVFGYEAAEIVGQPITKLIPPELHEEEALILARLKRGERIEHYETQRITKSGRLIDVSLTVSPVRDNAGRTIGASKVLRDVTQRKRAEETQRLLLGELSHRVKNSLATVQSIARQTLRRARTPAEFVSSFLGRLQALASAHGVLTSSNWQGAELNALVRSQLFVDDAGTDRIHYTGPEIMLQPQLALHLALVLHELGTNARKHGALSVPYGRVQLTWTVEERPHHTLHLTWSETGGPAVSLQSRPASGFGTQLIERSIRAMEGGEAEMRYEAEGIRWAFRVPIPVAPKRPRGSLSVLERPAAGNGSDEAQAQVARERILIIEDEPLVGMDMASTLTDAGFEVLGPVSTVDEALRLIASSDFDAALLDANLGGDPVDEVAAALTRRNIPFVLVTGYGQENLPKAFAAAPLLAKPFQTGALLKMTRQILAAERGQVTRLRERGRFDT